MHLETVKLSAHNQNSAGAIIPISYTQRITSVTNKAKLRDSMEWYSNWVIILKTLTYAYELFKNSTKDTYQ